MGNRESQLLSPSGPVPADYRLGRSPSAGLPLSLGSGGGGGGSSVSNSSHSPAASSSISLPTFSRRSLASSVSSLGLSLAAFGAPLAELESPLGSPVASAAAASPPPSAAAAAAAAAAATRPRIHPILRGGRQLSEDFCWVLPPRTNKRRAQQQQLADAPDAAAAVEAAAANPPPYGPGRTPLDLVRRVTDLVFGVTDEESCLALSLHRWDVEAAARYLMVEQLFRCCLADRDACRDLLGAHGWRLETAYAAAAALLL